MTDQNEQKNRLAHEYGRLLHGLLVCAMAQGQLPGLNDPWTYADGVSCATLGLLHRATGYAFDDLLTLAQEHGVTVYDAVVSEEWRQATGAPYGSRLPSVKLEELPFLLVHLSADNAPNVVVELARKGLRDLAYEVAIAGCQVHPFSELAHRFISWEMSKRKAGELSA